MKFLCLCAVFNHDQCWVENAIHCFQQQTHPDRTLLVLDDRPPEFRWPDVTEFMEHTDDNVLYAVVPNFRNMAKKYNHGLHVAEERGIEYSGITVYDDDDHYLPTALEQHAEVLKDHVWSTPETVLSIYGPSVIPVRVDGLYWASYAFRREITDKHGFVDYPGLGFDQEMVKMVRREYGPPGITRGIPYIYNWSGVQQHLSVTATSYTDTSWPDRVKPVAATGPLRPARHPLFDWAIREARNYL